ncbi:DUF1772 domain-containing protein [Microvirga makkahensis]|uniref:DUF1772 domain-containing protein n=1 Tax=Microvirga makkahensis TaxID=1128670 RepID=A0A7X3SP73_9HYPH|nr:DUF1772 domain-containing protein [Microvirga makkahensis]MXQ11960.1 DUF1772 domain-containing protein [Microvirga makkahensis]
MLRIWSFLSLTLAALSRGPCFAHVLEAPPRLIAWQPALWREATAFNGQFELFALVGGPLDLGAIAATAALAFRLRADRSRFRPAPAGFLFLAPGLAVWFGWVWPANAVIAAWHPGPIPEAFAAVRNRWETGHMAVAAVKLMGFGATAPAIAPRTRPLPEASRSR